MELSPSDFRSFFYALNDVEPFPWQTRLLETVAEHGRWPSLLDLPTGTGKTAALDVALFHLALEADRGEARRAPLRIVLVVDRRTVVDQSYRRALRIRERLLEGPGILEAVRKRLLSLAGPDSAPVPVQIALLRGGIARDDAWARSPNQPLVALSTVDQVGSRLLFRGYGVTDSMRPIHAGLLGSDTLLLLDEVHLSRPFARTLSALSSRYRSWAEIPLPDRWQFVQMSATAGDEATDRFQLDSKDQADDVLKERLHAARPVFLREPVRVAGSEDRRLQTFADAAVGETAPLLGPGKAIAVVVNRVRCARMIYDGLRTKIGVGADIRLLTGRMRPLDREQIESEIVPRVVAGRSASQDAKPLVVVATQCIEAGADFDFDALVTECASLDALRQRIGRLNRLGKRPCQGILLVRGDSAADDADPDPVYGDALRATWRYLAALGSEIDFGLSAFQLPSAEILEHMLSPRVDAPTLLPAHLDSWVQTNPVPEPESDIALWLHGPDRGAPDVQVIWRSDLLGSEIEQANEAALEAVRDRLTACPPSVAEALSVPLHEALAWLGRRRVDGLADVEGAAEGEAADEPKDSENRRAIAWRGDQTCFVGAPRDAAIRAGETLVVPSDYGGIGDHRNWDPDVVKPATDLAESAVLRSRGRAVLRLAPLMLSGVANSDIPRPDEEGSTSAENVRSFLQSLIDNPPSALSPGQRDAVKLLVKELASRRKPRIVPVERQIDGTPVASFVVVGRRIYRHGTDPSETTTDDADESGSFTGVEVELDRHLKGVGERARAYATRAGLPQPIIDDLALAGAWHDVGKADRRFQQLLRGGSGFAVTVATAPLAKSAVPQGDRQARRRARERSGLPDGFRHELVSISLMNHAAKIREQVHDWDLVLHLVASHHGYCRPFAPPIEDPHPVDVTFDGPDGAVRAKSDHQLARLDSGVSARFSRLIARYGWHGLASLEAILRLADHRQSEFEQEEKDET